MAARKKARTATGTALATTRARRKKTGKRGRPKVEIDRDAVRPLIAMGCNNEQIADCLGIARRTLQTRLAEDRKLHDAFRQMRGDRKRMVNGWATRAASQGNARIIIHLLEQECGHRRVKAVELSGPDGGPIEINQELRPLLEDKLSAYIRSKANGDG
jgi:hypothetical protein